MIQKKVLHKAKSSIKNNSSRNINYDAYTNNNQYHPINIYSKNYVEKSPRGCMKVIQRNKKNQQPLIKTYDDTFYPKADKHNSNQCQLLHSSSQLSSSATSLSPTSSVVEKS